MPAQPNLVTDEVIRELFLVACDYLRDQDGETSVHDGLLYDMATSQAKALNAMFRSRR